MTDTEARATACPYCHAQPFTNCINITAADPRGRFPGFIHRERKAKARLLADYHRNLPVITSQIFWGDGNG